MPRPQSGYVMAAVGTVSYQFNRDWLAFSTCSRASIDETLQGLENTPTNCLANDPRTPIGGPVCGDGIVSGTEECDDGAAGSNLCYGASGASPCTQKGGVQCAFGECCNTNTGTFKAAGSLCRNAMHQCDMPDYCSGSTHTCGADTIKPDGTACVEGGHGAKCYKGSCKGLDAQCSTAWSGYTGTWVHQCQNGIAASCESECGELKCTNTGWANYCNSYTCPSGYTCTLNGEQLSGPVTKLYASCQSVPGLPTPIMVADGTPCAVGGGADKICKNSQCVLRSSAGRRQLAGEACSAADGSDTCGANAVCTADIAGAEACKCKPGWAAAAGSTPANGCATKLTSCPQDCAAMNREGCVSASTCGACLAGFGARNPTLGAGDACSFVFPQPYNVTVAAVVPSSLAGAAGEADVAIEFGQHFALSFYRLVSGNSHPSQDPYSWVLEGRTGSGSGSGSPGSATWQTVDTQMGVVFGARHQAMTFAIKSPLSPAPTFAHYRFRFLGVKDAAHQLAAGATESTSIVVDAAAGTKELKSTLQQVAVPASTRAQLQLAEIALFTPDAVAGTIHAVTPYARVPNAIQQVQNVFDQDLFTHMILDMPGTSAADKLLAEQQQQQQQQQQQPQQAGGSGSALPIALSAVGGCLAVGAAAFFGVRRYGGGKRGGATSGVKTSAGIAMNEKSLSVRGLKFDASEEDANLTPGAAGTETGQDTM